MLLFFEVSSESIMVFVKYKRFFVGFLLLASIALTLEWLSNQAPRGKHHGADEAVFNGPEIPEFKLLDQDGSEFTQLHFRNRWTFLFFGFTSCPDVCPTTLAMLRQVADEIDQHAGYPVSDVQVVMVSIDPEVDTQDVIKSYMSKFREDFIGLHGSVAEVDRLAIPLGLAYQKPSDSHAGHTADGDSMNLQHTPAVLFISPDSKVYKLFTPPHDPQDLVGSYFEAGRPEL